MTPAKPKLALSPEECDGCGRCERACPQGAMRVGTGYIYVDWDRCDGCLECVGACDRGAVEERGTGRPSPRAVPVAASAPTAGATAPGFIGRFASVAARARAQEGEAEDLPCPPCWSLVETGAVLALSLLLFVVNDAVFSSALFGGLEVRGLIMARALVLGTYYAAQLTLLWFLVRRRGTDLGDAFRLRLRRVTVGAVVSSTLLVGLLFVGTRVLATLYGAFAQGLGFAPPERWNASLTEVFGPDALGLALSVAMVVVVGPFVEELVFRGVVFGAFREKWGPGIAVVGSAMLFGASHFSLWTLFPSVVLGLALGWLADMRPSLWPSIALHSLYNAAAVGAAFYLAGQVG